jgi:2-C-methyl-D-erythritol 4-phosphate cytidylyltransferase
MTDLWAVIPAGGKGLRFGSQVPKQYMPVAGRPVLDHVLAAFLKTKVFKAVVVPVPPDDRRFDELALSNNDCVYSIQGGAERADSVQAGLDWIQAQGAHADDWVFVHDAARPLITQHELHGLVDAIESSTCPGVVLGIPAADTLKRVDQINPCPEESDSCIAETVDRTGLWHAMTPQVFRLGGLSEALQAAKQSGLVVTDESQAMEANGRLPWLIRGRRSNIKLTYPEDLELIEALLSAREGASL